MCLCPAFFYKKLTPRKSVVFVIKICRGEYCFYTSLRQNSSWNEKSFADHEKIYVNAGYSWCSLSSEIQRSLYRHKQTSTDNAKCSTHTLSVCRKIVWWNYLILKDSKERLTWLVEATHKWRDARKIIFVSAQMEPMKLNWFQTPISVQSTSSIDGPDECFFTWTLCVYEAALVSEYTFHLFALDADLLFI